VSSAVQAVSPIDDPSRKRRLVKVAAWILGCAALLLVLQLLGVDVRGWLEEFWDSMKEISVQYLILGGIFQLAQTTFVAIAWYGIVAYGWPDSGVTFRPVLAAYAVSVALNNVLPANLGTLVLLIMLLAIVPGSTFPGIFTAYLVQKIFYTVVGALVYLYLFLTVPGSFDASFGGLDEHPVLVLAIIAGAVVLLVILGRIFWRKLKSWWEKAKEGGRILTEPKVFVRRVLVPQSLGYLCKLAVIAIFLAAFSVPVTFHSVMSVVGSSSIANTVSVTPGGVGVNQAANVVALQDYTSSENAAAYSTAQQLFTTAVNIGFALVLTVWVFGWTGGKQLVGSSYVDAKVKAAEMKADRDAKKEAKRAERQSHLPWRKHGEDDAGEPPDAPPDGGT
jgi:uncharacterized membrane protein YbhN (UPF0104 family)